MEVIAVLKALDKLNNSLLCFVCTKKCTDPIRIKVCGHYFCENCIQKYKSKHVCPKCKSYFDDNELDYDNLARDTEKYLNDLRDTLEGVMIKQPLTEITESSDASQKSNTFVHETITYHVNYVDVLCKKRNAKGESNLHVCCKRKKIDEVKSLLQQTVDINIKDYAGWAPLHEAVESQSLEIVEELLKHGALVNIPGSDYVTPLHKATLRDDLEMVTLLLKYGANPNLIDYNGLKPLDCTKHDKIQKVFSSTLENLDITKEIFISKKIVVYCHSIDDIIKNKLNNCKNISVAQQLDMKKKITHFLIKKTHKLSFKIIIAMLEGLQFFTVEFLEDYLKGNYFVPIPDYTFINNRELNRGIQLSMLNSLFKQPKLFDGLNFFIENHTSPIQVFNLKVDKEYLINIIKSGGGRMLIRAPALRVCEESFHHPYHAKEDSDVYRCCHYIIFEKDNPPELQYNMKELQHKSSEWLIKCVINFEITS